MNWNKAQTILIVTLILLNLTLFYMNYKQEDKYTLSLSRQSEMQRILELNNIIVYDQLPQYNPLPRLKVREYSINETNLLNKFFNSSKEVSLTITANGRQYEKNNEKFVITTKGEDKGIIRYYQENNTKISMINESVVLDIAKDFVKKITLNQGKWKMSNIFRMDNNTYTVIFNEDYKGYPIFNSYVKLEINEFGIKDAEFRRIVPEGFVKPNHTIYPIDQVLYNFMYSNNLNNNELIRITNIDLGYETSKNINGEEIRQYIEPYYIIRLANGEEFFINAYSNTFE
ncbi:hypothetical protein EDC18_11023 [Natranaerovirga pectinivora]|uniref:Regulatory protein YycI of two-component signal transduction system YycFG n=1 Tax=Natranaerovirga pectinivora TaxID=682400 RepID=A0A4R3MGZ7_9FIRM|nr:hypothetical protein [Natranaerovirga pectinivora]TCT12949.1 hypothetical protein EDC18_11023 [Natranaerovirga pectinivora]